MKKCVIVHDKLLWKFFLQDDNIKACLPYEHTADEYSAKDTELVVGLSLSIAFIVIEMMTFGTGLTMFSNFATVFCKWLV